MGEDGVIEVCDGVVIPRAELEIRASRAGGPGGQHVNTSSTRIELFWNVATTSALTEEQRARVRARLAGRIDGQGVLRVVASAHRSQFQNREAATERLRSLVALALRVPRRRRKTRPPASAREARLRAKKHRSRIKQARRSVDADE